MLTDGNLKYLETISDTELVNIENFNPRTQVEAKNILSEITSTLPQAQTLYFGSSALGLNGENDIDLGVIDAEEYMRGGLTLRKLYGEPCKVDEKNHVIRWEFVRKGFTVELFLSDVLEGRRREHIRNHTILEHDENLKRTYQNLKRSSTGLTKRAYMRRKLEFFNGIGHDSGSNIVD